MSDDSRERRVRGTGPATLMTAGLAWVGGRYSWPGPQLVDQVLVALAHLAPVALALLAIHALGRDRWAGTGRLTLTVLAIGIKTMTVVAVLWTIVDPAAGFGPHGLWDWLPLGLANAGGGLWLKTVLFPPRVPRGAAA